MHITPFREKNFPLDYLLAISMAESLVANKILYCIVLLYTDIHQLTTFTNIALFQSASQSFSFI